ncbi:MAG: NfeD family protein [Bacillota bacterium]|jgi:membrane-bound serine protease (ClpP class)
MHSAKVKDICRKIFIAFLLIGLIMVPFASLAVQAANEGQTYLIPISGDIDNTMLNFIQKSYTEAVLNGAEAIIFEIDTYGGLMDAAISIKELIFNAQVPTACFVNAKAISAGSLIALAGQKLAMCPGSTIGAAEPRIGNKKTDEKVLSMWSAELSATAEARGKDGTIAAAFADSDIVIEGLKKQGKLLTLTDSKALEVGIADIRANNSLEVAEQLDFSTDLVNMDLSFQDRIADWLSSPLIAALLLTIGIAGLIIELVTVSSGAFGAIGLFSFALFFAGNFWAGNAGWLSIVMFGAGLILLVVEVFVLPGFGVAGVLGLAALFASIVFASPSITYAIIAILIAVAAAAALIFFSVKNKKIRTFWRKLILSHKLDSDEGYDSADKNLMDLKGAEGIAITPLRPAGTAVFDQKRIDVVTEGEFIDNGAPVKVIGVEGVRVIVRQKEIDKT